MIEPRKSTKSTKETPLRLDSPRPSDGRGIEGEGKGEGWMRCRNRRVGPFVFSAFSRGHLTFGICDRLSGIKRSVASVPLSSHRSSPQPHKENARPDAWSVPRSPGHASAAARRDQTWPESRPDAGPFGKTLIQMNGPAGQSVTGLRARRRLRTIPLTYPLAASITRVCAKF